MTNSPQQPEEKESRLTSEELQFLTISGLKYLSDYSNKEKTPRLTASLPVVLDKIANGENISNFNLEESHSCFMVSLLFRPSAPIGLEEKLNKLYRGLADEADTNQMKMLIQLADKKDNEEKELKDKQTQIQKLIKEEREAKQQRIKLISENSKKHQLQMVRDLGQLQMVRDLGQLQMVRDLGQEAWLKEQRRILKSQEEEEADTKQ